ncbi:molybdopterin cofactor-binding domain-containing protein [Propylenella binzhouense]|uniref:Xanthine dehydrogenase family protein molybdopterin-binding subunit n=1 Tax=Propylenella binzhouense TaxID=2555902 RepID=A0A964T4Z6_9HYPH|nr:xanthine dehydrogenase family protein molybdopterin-binding subunit [Propylenella binzhouense]
MTHVGSPLPRLEDARLLAGRGRFTDDVHPDGLLEAHVLRSPHGHARIARIDAAAARALPGVVAVFTFDDLVGVERQMPMILPDRRILHPKTQLLLAAEVVRYVGEPVAFVVAETRYLAEDAAELIEVAYEPLPAASALADAASPGGRPVHADVPDNVAGADEIGFGDAAAALAASPRRLRRRFDLARGHAQPLEPRATVARFDADTDLLTVWDTTQGPIPARAALAAMLGLGIDQVRVIAGDIGGGFGPKMVLYPEEVLVAHAAMRLGRPVKWVEDRMESFVATASEREQIHEVEVGFDEEGRLLGLVDHFWYETGAYIPYGLNTPFVTTMHLLGLYRVPALAVSFQAVFTNRMFVCPYRGAGRPYSAFVIERIMDLIARELGLEPAEVRRRNLIPPEAMPYRYPLTYWDGGPVEFDSGDYPGMLEEALARVGYREIRAAQAAARGEGRYVGVAAAAYCEITGIGPYEGTRVRVQPGGRITVATGVGSQGQGHHTTLAQIVADELGVAPERIEVTVGDTAQFDWGIGSFASRGAVTAGNAARIAARKVARQAREWASEMLEVDAGDLELAEGSVRLKGVPEVGVPLEEIARRADPARGRIGRDPETFRPGLEADGFFNPAQGTMGAGFHACAVEVDPSTGTVAILKYVVVHDCGTVINPLIVEGQVVGGAALGIGGAFYERVAYDEEAQLLTSTYMDYLIPTASEVPAIDVVHFESRSPHNPLGVKGVGEAGTLPVAPALVGAIEDALAPFGATFMTMPLAGPDAVRAAIRAACAARGEEGCRASGPV